MKFTKHHNRVARKNLLKARNSELIRDQNLSGKSDKQVVHQSKSKKSSWSLQSILNNLSLYFPGETTKIHTRKRTHPPKKSAKLNTSAVTKPTKTTMAAKK